MLAENHQEIEARAFDGHARLRGIQSRRLRNGKKLERGKFDGPCLEDKSVSLMLNDAPDGEFIHRWTKIFNDRDQREILHLLIVSRISRLGRIQKPLRFHKIAARATA